MLTHADLLSADDEGRAISRPWIKNPAVATTAGIWLDLSFFGRYPAAEYFTAGAANARQALRRSTHGGLDHGEAGGSDVRKWLRGMTSLTTTAGAVPLQFLVMDYLAYYPLIAMEDVQVMDNAVALPRLASLGGQIMLVEQFPYVGGGTLRVTYTNQDGVTGRLSPIMTINTQTVLGTVATSAPDTSGCAGPFVPLAQGDRSARAVESIEFFTSDAGNLAAILVNPLAPFAHYDTTCPSEWDFWRDLGLLPLIDDDAYLSLACRPAGSITGAIIDGQIRTLWTGA